MLYSPAFTISNGFPLGAGVRAGLRLLALRFLAGMQAFPPVFGIVQPCTARMRARLFLFTRWV